MRAIVVFTLIVSFSFAANADAQFNSLSVVDYGIAKDAQSHVDLPKSQRLKSPIPKIKPVVLWTRLTGDQSALDALRSLGQFPIYHHWTSTCSSSDNQDKKVSVQGDGIDTLAGFQQFIHDMQIEIVERKRRGLRPYFDWRTISKVDAVVGCTYEISVELWIKDRLNDHLSCRTSEQDVCYPGGVDDDRRNLIVFNVKS
jgi:hypothetical protein